MKFKNNELKFSYIDEKLCKILEQTTKHNGRLSRMETAMLIFSTAVVVLLIANGSEFASFVMKIFS